MALHGQILKKCRLNIKAAQMSLIPGAGMIGMDQARLENTYGPGLENIGFPLQAVMLPATRIQPHHIPVVDMGFECKGIGTGEDLHARIMFVCNGHGINFALMGSRVKLKGTYNQR